MKLTRYMDWTNLRVRRIEGTKDRAIIGIFKCLAPLNDSIEVDAIGYRRSSSGEYVLLPYRDPRKPFCDYYRDDKFVLPELIEASDLPPQGTCPVLAVSLKIKTRK